MQQIHSLKVDTTPTFTQVSVRSVGRGRLRCHGGVLMPLVVLEPFVRLQE